MDPGKGKGQGNPPQGEGGFDYCKCTKCDYKTEHVKGRPCNTRTCPKCGATLTGSD